jgi:hypothetical protein
MIAKSLILFYDSYNFFKLEYSHYENSSKLSSQFLLAFNLSSLGKLTNLGKFEIKLCENHKLTKFGYVPNEKSSKLSS